MKNKFLSSKIIIILMLVIISIFIECGLIFAKKMYIGKQESYVIDKIDYNNKEIVIDVGNRYIEKIDIKYSTKEDVRFKLKYSNNSDREKKIQEVFDNEIDKQVINIKSYVKKINIVGSNLGQVKIEKIFVNNHIEFNYLVCFYIFCSLLLLYVLYYGIKNGINFQNIHKYYFIVGLIIGLLFIVLEPSATYYSWDDQIHFSNVYQLPGGNIEWNVGEFSMIDGSPVGRGSINSYEDYLNQREYLNSGKKAVYISTSGRMLTYTKIAYIPPAIGYYFFKMLGLPFSVCFRMGKVMILLSYLLIMSYAIKISKIGKKLLTLIGLIPSCMFLATQYSYDPAVISGFILASVQLVNWFVDEKSDVNFKSMLIFILALLYASFVKAVYIPLLFMFLFIPKSRFKSNRTCKQVKIFSMILLLLIMYTFVMPTFGNGAVGGDLRGGDTSVSGQISWILSYPFHYIELLFKTMFINHLDYYVGPNAFIFFAYLGYLHNWCYYLLAFFLLFVIFTEHDDYRLKLKERALFLVMVFGIIALIWTALYLSFTPVGKNYIDGVQPRYFLPILYIMFICIKLPILRIKIPEKIYNIIIFMIPIVVSMVSIYTLILVKICL